jgi:hypothetical protein
MDDEQLAVVFFIELYGHVSFLWFSYQSGLTRSLKDLSNRFMAALPS